ncbi:MAG TPA: tripartite tricarboxylate transporter substrate binding protein [Xanthobacteraceae bacterium]|nr:tripartite tricarboxylate transporter substrate binding protein [Xanthobacteraceae bacterium]
MTARFARRDFLQLAAAGAALPLLAGPARAQAYPTQPVRIIVPFPAGQAADSISRIVAQALSARLGQQFIVENRPGAGGNIGTEAAVHASPDGYTILFEVMTANAINASLYPHLKFNFINDVAPVALIGGSAYVMTVQPSFPAKTVAEFVAYAKANPGKINMGSAGIGTPPHMFGELFKITTGIDMVHVPYSGSYVPDLLSGQVQVVFAPVPTVVAHIRAGRLRALGVTTATPSPALPGVPAIADAVPGYDASGYFGIGAPKAMPAAIVDELNGAINAGLADPTVTAKLANLGLEPQTMTPAQYGKLIADETAKWAKVVKSAGIKAE